MENPNPTPSAAQQAENNGSGRTFTQDEVNSLQIGLPVSAPRVPSARATLTHEKKI